MNELWRYFFLGLVAYYGVIVPLHIVATYRWRPRAIEEVELTGLGAKAQAYFQKRSETMRELGFVPEKTVEFRYLLEPYRVVSIYFQHPEHKLFAYLSALVGTEEGNSCSLYVLIGGHYESGQELGVLNTTAPASWLPLPQTRVYHLDGLDDLRTLFELGLYVHAQHGATFPEDVLKENDHSLERLRRLEREHLDHQVVGGVLHHDPKFDLYRCTLRGAYRMMLTTYMPFSAIVKLESREKAQALKASYEKWKTSQQSDTTLH